METSGTWRERWCLWDELVLRCAGFPARLALLPSCEPDEASFERGVADSADRLRAFAREPRVREALAWQNRPLLQTLLAPYLASEGTARNARARDREKVLVSYLQRYCLKNDTIGFFGPHVWGAVDRDIAHVEVSHGERPLRRRMVHLEHWCADALARRVEQLEGVAPWLPLALAPGVVREEARRAAASHSPEEAFALERVDGVLHEAALRAEAVLLGIAPSQLSEVLQRLEARGEIIRGLRVPTALRDPEQALEQWVARIGDWRVRDRVQALLARLRSHKAELAAAAGDAERVDVALASLEAWFQETTATAPTRQHGKTYAARTLAHEDCERDTHVRLGARFEERLMEPLSLVLEGARWMLGELARGYLELFETLAREVFSGASEGPFLPFWRAVAPRLPMAGQEAPAFVRAARRELSRRWAEVLGLTGSERRVHRDVKALRPAVARAFANAGEVWPSARIHSPDVLISRAGDVRRGEYSLVLGEAHLSFNTTETPLFLETYPEPSRLASRLAGLFPRGRVSFALPPSTALRGNVCPLTPLPGDVVFEVDEALSWRAPGSTLRAADLRVTRRGERLGVAAPDGRWWDVLEFLDFALCGHDLELLERGAHSPRVTLDGLVVSREAWRIPSSELRFAWASTERERFAGARAFAEARGLPRHVFYRPGGEWKPVYADLAAPAYVELLARHARTSPVLTFSEMLPTPEELWLEDSSGALYAGELRLVVSEPLPAGARRA